MKKWKPVLASTTSAAWIVTRSALASAALGAALNWSFLVYFLRRSLPMPDATTPRVVPAGAAVLVLALGFPFLYLLLGKAHGTRAALARLYATHRVAVLNAVEQSVRQRHPEL